MKNKGEMIYNVKNTHEQKQKLAILKKAFYITKGTLECRT